MDLDYTSEVRRRLDQIRPNADALGLQKPSHTFQTASKLFSFVEKLTVKLKFYLIFQCMFH